MRRRDERFAEQDKHLAKPDPLHDKTRQPTKPRLFGSEDFMIAPDQSHATCPAGKRLHRNGKDCTIGGYAAIKFRAPEAACQGCPLRTKCLRKPQTTRSRQVAVLTRKAEPTHSQRMRERIDSAWGREQYGCNDPAVPAQVRPLKHTLERVSSCPVPDAGAGGCRS